MARYAWTHLMDGALVVVDTKTKEALHIYPRSQKAAVVAKTEELNRQWLKGAA